MRRGVGVGVRTTPACAGSTSSGLTALAACTDHPRLRGEHTFY